MLRFIDKLESQRKIGKIANLAIFLFILSLPLSNTFMNLALALILILYFLGGDYRTKINEIKGSPPTIFFLLLFLWTIISAFYSQASSVYIEHDLLKYKKILLLPALIYFLKDKDLKPYIFAFLIGTALMILYTLLFDQHGLILSLSSKSFIYSNNPIRNYITEGIFLSISLFGCLWFIKNNIKIFSMFILLSLLLLQITFNNGRMALISLGLSIVIFIYFSIQKKSTKLLTIAAAVVVCYGIYLTIPLIHTRVDRTISEASQIINLSSADSIRLQYWKLSFDNFIQSPLLGFGPGSFRQMIVDSNIPGEFQLHGHAHQEFLFISLQYGLIGLTLFVGALYFALRKFSVKETSPARVIAYVGILIMLLNCMTDSHLYAMVEGHIFILMLGIYLSKDINYPIKKGS